MRRGTNNETSSLPFSQVDAFTDRPFAGNPAAVMVLPEPRREEWMQAVAREMNLSETAFLNRRKDGFALRWFTPAVEVELCGHATLASAHILWEEGHLRAGDTARFHTRSGLLTARRDGGWIELDFPACPEQPTAAPVGLFEALGVASGYVGLSTGNNYLVEVDSEETLRGLTPDFRALARIPIGGFIVTTRSSSPPFDFLSRYFAPGQGVDEDPVTGSAHCCLGPFWGKRLGKTEFLAHQVSLRGGTVRVKLQANRVLLGGEAITVMHGKFHAG